MAGFDWSTTLAKALRGSRHSAFYLWTLPAAFLSLIASGETEKLHPALTPVFLSALALLLGIYFLQAYLKANLVEELRLRHSPAGPKTQEGWSLAQAWILLKRTLSIELFFLCLGGIFALLLLSPLGLASLYNQAALRSLSGFVIIVALPLLAFLILLRELLYLYVILSKLRVSLALESCFALLSQKSRDLLRLFLLAFLSFLAFTISLNVAMLMGVPIGESLGIQNSHPFLKSGFLVLSQAWFLTFWQSLWFHGFHSIARIEKPDAEKKSETEEVPSPAL